MIVLSISLLPSMSGWVTNSCSAVAVALRIEGVDLVQPVVRRRVAAVAGRVVRRRLRLPSIVAPWNVPGNTTQFVPADHMNVATRT